TFMPKRKSCGSVLRCALPPFDPVLSIGPPTASLMHPACPPRCSPPSIRFACMRASTWPVLASCLPSTAAPTCNTHSACCLPPEGHTSRDFVPWCSSAAGRLTAWLDCHSGGRNQRRPFHCALSYISRLRVFE